MLFFSVSEGSDFAYTGLGDFLTCLFFMGSQVLLGVQKKHSLILQLE